MVTCGADGKVETVRYLALVSILLNELNKQARENQRQGAQSEASNLAAAAAFNR